MIAAIIAFFSTYWLYILWGIIIGNFLDDVGTIAENSNKMAKDKNPPQLPKTSFEPDKECDIYPERVKYINTPIKEKDISICEIGNWEDFNVKKTVPKTVEIKSVTKYRPSDFINMICSWEDTPQYLKDETMKEASTETISYTLEKLSVLNREDRHYLTSKEKRNRSFELFLLDIIMEACNRDIPDEEWINLTP